MHRKICFGNVLTIWRVCAALFKMFRLLAWMRAPWGDGKSFLVNMIYQDEVMKKCEMQQAAELKVEDVKYISGMPVPNRVLTEIHELKT